MKTLTFMNIKEGDILDREELRNVMAGSGGSGDMCVAYCCDSNNDCNFLGQCGACSGTTNEACQASLINAGFSCGSGQYLAALYQPPVW
jgi:hypothetical protein